MCATVLFELFEVKMFGFCRILAIDCGNLTANRLLQSLAGDVKIFGGRRLTQEWAVGKSAHQLKLYAVQEKISELSEWVFGNC